MMLSLMIAAALAAGPADDPTVSTLRQPAAAAAAETDGGASANPARRYCVKQTTTGSRIAKKECRTRDDWLSHGWDPLEAMKK